MKKKKKDIYIYLNQTNYNLKFSLKENKHNNIYKYLYFYLYTFINIKLYEKKIAMFISEKNYL